jgi:ABC-type dipeptide/oligopeptide/nickel transport system permease subunit
VLILGVALVQLPGIARLIRTSTLEVATRGYVEASIARGERTVAILRHDILPNIMSVVMSDFGIRFGYSVILIASMNYLNLGLQPPAADWGLMISENRTYIGFNPWPVVAPAILLAAVTVGVNLVGDAYVRSLGISTPARRRRSLRRPGAATSAPTS